MKWLRDRRFWLVSSAALVLLMLLGAVSMLNIPSLQQLIGVPVPPTATDVQIDVRRNMLDMLLGDYKSYVRFELPAQDVQRFLSHPTFQQVHPSNSDPFTVFDGSSEGSTPMKQIVIQNRPSWWMPELGSAFMLAYRSAGGQNPGADSAWYIVDMSDPLNAIVYVFLVEV
jgi:hypothetical protein